VSYGVIVKSRMWSSSGSHSIRVRNDMAGRRVRRTKGSCRPGSCGSRTTFPAACRSCRPS
jgi:hypothetical protein